MMFRSEISALALSGRTCVVIEIDCGSDDIDEAGQCCGYAVVFACYVAAAVEMLVGEVISVKQGFHLSGNGIECEPTQTFGESYSFGSYAREG